MHVCSMDNNVSRHQSRRYSGASKTRIFHQLTRDMSTVPTDHLNPLIQRFQRWWKDSKNHTRLLWNIRVWPADLTTLTVHIQFYNSKLPAHAALCIRLNKHLSTTSIDPPMYGKAALGIQTRRLDTIQRLKSSYEFLTQSQALSGDSRTVVGWQRARRVFN